MKYKVIAMERGSNSDARFFERLGRSFRGLLKTVHNTATLLPGQLPSLNLGYLEILALEISTLLLYGFGSKVDVYGTLDPIDSDGVTEMRTQRLTVIYKGLILKNGIVSGDQGAPFFYLQQWRKDDEIFSCKIKSLQIYFVVINGKKLGLLERTAEINAWLRTLEDNYNLHFEKNALQVELQKKNEELERKTLQDPLTTLLNRRGLWMAMVEIGEMLEREIHKSYTMATLDIDFFKRVNDVFDHTVGDTVLQKFAQIMREYFRDIDKPVRQGGEEFTLLLPNISGKDAFVRLDNFRNKVSQELISIQLSIGQYNNQGSLSLSQMLVNLIAYEKKNGRHRIQPNEELTLNQIKQDLIVNGISIPEESKDVVEVIIKLFAHQLITSSGERITAQQIDLINRRVHESFPEKTFVEIWLQITASIGYIDKNFELCGKEGYLSQFKKYSKSEMIEVVTKNIVGMSTGFMKELSEEKLKALRYFFWAIIACDKALADAKHSGRNCVKPSLLM